MKLHSRSFLPITILIIGIVFSFGFVAFAQSESAATNVAVTATPQNAGIVFPVPELGNCTDKTSCRTYCNDPANSDACVTFAQNHGLTNKDEAARAKKFIALLKSGGGPGGCTTPDGCQTFCSQVANFETCAAFAEKQGFKGENYEQSKKILNYVKQGGQLPGSCTSEQSCRTYCSDLGHAEECASFGQKAGLRPPMPVTNAESSDRIKKITELARTGKTPGGCSSKETCAIYCADQAHRNECITFGEQTGLIPQAEAERIRAIQGTGPGGCTSPEACRAYCNDSANRETCFKFAEEHNLLPPTEIKDAKENLVRARQGFEDVPPEVKACVTTALGDNALTDIQTGKLVPSSDAGIQVRSCFEKFGAKPKPQDAFKNAPPEIATCLKEKLGDAFSSIQSGQTMLTPEMADIFRACNQTVRIQQGFSGDSVPKTGGPMRPINPPPVDFLKTAPEAVSLCIKEKFGADITSQGTAADILSKPESRAIIQACFQNFKPEKPIQDKTTGEFKDTPRPPSMGISNLPPAVQLCIKENLDAENYAKISQNNTAGISSEAKAAVQTCMNKFKNTSPTNSIPPPKDLPLNNTNPNMRPPLEKKDLMPKPILLPDRPNLGAGGLQKPPTSGTDRPSGSNLNSPTSYLDQPSLALVRVFLGPLFDIGK